jgi:NADPH:quinone reductase-like Zn-dependent oxidoreductase
MVKSYGAKAVFDYNEPTCIEKIRIYTKNSLKYVLDCISEPETMQFCYGCLGRTGGKYTSLEPFPQFLHTRPSVQADWVLGPVLLGKPITWGAPFQREGNPAMREFALKWFTTVQRLLDNGSLKNHPLRLMHGGLSSIPGGMELLRQKVISGEKLVYHIP